MATVIYSALIGGYERPILQPIAKSLGIDMIMFTDDVSKLDGSDWNAVKVDPRFPTDTVRSARYLKTVGHPELDQYDRTIWVDNRVVLKDGVEKLFDQLDSHELVLAKHSIRATIRDEYEEVIASGYDDPNRVRATFDLSLACGVDVTAPPLWTGLLLRQRNERVARCMRVWMDHILVGSRRDQLSVHAALACVPLDTRILDIDNKNSMFHDWVPVSEILRNRSIQRWRKPRRSLGLRFADLIRSNETTRRSSRILQRMGTPLPTLDQRPD